MSYFLINVIEGDTFAERRDHGSFLVQAESYQEACKKIKNFLDTKLTLKFTNKTLL